MYAVIETGSKQYKVAKGDVLEVEKLKIKDPKKVTIDNVLLTNVNRKVNIGTPMVSGAQVICESLGEKKAKKVIAFKYKRRKGYHRKVGHRQKLILLRVTDIVVK